MNLLYDTFYPALPIFAQNWMCTAAGFRRHRARFNRHYQKVLRDWERTVSLPLIQWRPHARREREDQGPSPAGGARRRPAGDGDGLHQAAHP